jgi:hypothetical protein
VLRGQLLAELARKASNLGHGSRGKGALAEILQWLNQHDIDAVLVEPPYNSALVSDEHYTALRAAIRNGARQNGVPLVLRFEALQYLARQRSEAARS